MSNMAKTAQWWRGGVIYQIYPRSFMDSNGDGIGDLHGIIERLPYIAKLGVDAIWISPFFKSPMKDFGYDVSDYKEVDPIFGSLEDFRKLLDRAHNLGLKVMIDQVWPHTSDQHRWFIESRQNKSNLRHDWYVWADPKPDGTAPNNWLSQFGGPAWTWDSRREQYYLHHFLKEQPVLNFWNPAVRNAIKDTASFWLDLGVDGFRLDAIQTFLSDKDLTDNPVNEIPDAHDVPRSNPMSRQVREYTSNLPETMDWMEEVRSFTNQWSDRCMLAEVGWSQEEAAIKYAQTQHRLHLAYTPGLGGSGMTKDDVLDAINKVESNIKDGWFCWAISNHDFKRVASRIKGSASIHRKAQFATVLGMTLRGTYCMYQGEELGLPQADLAYDDLVDPYDKMLYPEHVGRDGCRTPMPWFSAAPHAGFSSARKTWLPVVPNHIPLAVDQQEKNEDSTLQLVRQFIHWRRQTPAMRLGDIDIIESDEIPDDVIVIHRKLDYQSIYAVFNCGDQERVLPAKLLHKSDMIEPVSSRSHLEHELLVLEPFGFAFFH